MEDCKENSMTCMLHNCDLRGGHSSRISISDHTACMKGSKAPTLVVSKDV